MFLDCALITFCSQLAYHSLLVVRADGYLKMASDLAGVGCVEGTRCQPNMRHPRAAADMVFVWGWVWNVEQAMGWVICFFWLQLSTIWLPEAEKRLWSFSTNNREHRHLQIPEMPVLGWHELLSRHDSSYPSIVKGTQGAEKLQQLTFGCLNWGI